jgi:hypothetical protein
MDLCRLLEPNVFEAYPNVTTWMTRVEALTGVKDYLEKRPDCVDIGTKPMLRNKV